MFDALRPQAPDMILRLMEMFRDDPRAGKIDLGVGVYRDASGRTPVMRAVREAGRRMWEAEATKAYTAMPGDAAFLDAMRRLVLGHEGGAAIATPGGTGALRQAFELIRLARPEATVRLPDPTWSNHPALIAAVGLRQ